MQDNKKIISKAKIDDVAKMAGVSKTTISRFLSGQFASIAEHTRTKIALAIKELKYRPNRLARGLKGSRSGSIGIILSDVGNPYFTSILRGAEEVCRQHGHNLMVFNMSNDPVKEKESILMLQSHRIDGLIISSTGYNNDLLRELQEDGVLIVLIDRKIPELDADFVGNDNLKATADAISHLLKCSYDRIAYFSRTFENISSRIERANAFRNNLRELGHPSLNDIYQVEVEKPEALESSLNEFLLKAKNQHACIFAGNAMILLKIVIMLQGKGIEIPDDISIICFDDPEWAAVIKSGITAISQPTELMGVIAMNRLLQRIEGDKSNSEVIELEAELHIRGSTRNKLN